MIVSYEDAKKIFDDCDFDRKEWHRKHTLRLAAAVMERLNDLSPEYLPNLLATAEHYYKLSLTQTDDAAALETLKRAVDAVRAALENVEKVVSTK